MKKKNKPKGTVYAWTTKEDSSSLNIGIRDARGSYNLVVGTEQILMREVRKYVGKGYTLVDGNPSNDELQLDSETRRVFERDRLLETRVVHE